MMMVYQDWRCLWPGTILMMGLHCGFAVLRNSGYEIYFFEDGRFDLTRLWFQFGIALVATAVCGYWARVLCGQTLQLARQQLSLERGPGTAQNQGTAAGRHSGSTGKRGRPANADGGPDAARAVHGTTGGVLKRLSAALDQAHSGVEKASEVERP